MLIASWANFRVPEVTNTIFMNNLTCKLKASRPNHQTNHHCQSCCCKKWKRSMAYKRWTMPFKAGIQNNTWHKKSTSKASGALENLQYRSSQMTNASLRCAIQSTIQLSERKSLSVNTCKHHICNHNALLEGCDFEGSPLAPSIAVLYGGTATQIQSNTHTHTFKLNFGIKLQLNTCSNRLLSWYFNNTLDLTMSTHTYKNTINIRS